MKHFENCQRPMHCHYFLANSSMMMLKPVFNFSTDDTSGLLANRIQILEKSLDTLMEESKKNTQFSN